MHSLIRIILDVTLLPEQGNWLILLADLVALATVPSVLIQRHGRPIAALSWILALLTIPLVGVLWWWLFGRIHLRRKTKKRQAASARVCEDCPVPVSNAKELPKVFRQVTPFALKGRRWSEGVFPPTLATGIQLLTDGRVAFSQMEKAIKGARSEIRALFYIWQSDKTGERFVELLSERAKAGVKVRVLVDEFGGRRFRRGLAKRLLRAGVEVECFISHFWAPSWNFRNHRKLLIVDSIVAFTGGMNVGEEYESKWNDLMIRVQGAVIRNFDDVFREDWYFACGRSLSKIEGSLEPGDTSQSGLFAVVASGPDRTRNRVHDGFFLSICSARERLWLTSPYFIPSPPIINALAGAAQRGVDVRLLLPHRKRFDTLGLAARSFLPNLVREGVRLFEYLPRFLHAKSLVIDDKMAFIGSANTDTRSFRLNFELGCFVESQCLNESIAKHFESNLRDSNEIQLSELTNQPGWKICLESLAHLTSPLL